MMRERDYSISFARFIAMCMIVICHIMQRDNIQIYGINMASWFNVGVQMFLYISGILNGRHNITDSLPFYKRTFIRILTDYYLFVIIIIPIYCIWDSENINANGIWNLLTVSGTINGLGHLWFVQLILFCYLLTPLLKIIIDNIYNENNKVYLCKALPLVIVEIISIDSRQAMWVVCYTLGMIFSKLDDDEKSTKAITRSVVLISILSMLMHFYFKVCHTNADQAITTSYNIAHVALGILLVFFLRDLYKAFMQKKCDFKLILQWSDMYSYDVYLVHHIFIQSSFACVNYIRYRTIALPIAVILTVGFSILLNKFSEIVKRRVLRLY